MVGVFFDGLAPRPCLADRTPHAAMMRYPDISATQVVFVYAGQLWLVPREGGLARPLARPPGDASFPRFSPDGQTIAFVANYDGNNDLYTIPVEGGVPTRVTFHPAGEILCDWTPDGRLLFFARGYYDLNRQSHLLTVDAGGGLPERLPVPYGAVGAISPDGTTLAYTPHTTDFRTWKRYLGGMATDIWLLNLQDRAARRITDWEGTDSQPMWHGRAVYYISDAGPEHQLNIWVYDVDSGRREQVTRFDTFDVKWPAIGPGPDGGGEIVFQLGARLMRLDLKTRQAHDLPVRVPGDRPEVRPLRVDQAPRIEQADISPTGKRAVFEARGDIWTLPGRRGSSRNLTRSAGVAERMPSWSPDGRWIAYFSDATGEYELYVRPAYGSDEARQLTGAGRADDESAAHRVYRYDPTWSPDGRYIAFTDKAGRLFLTTVESGATRLVDSDPWAARPELSWSHDARWLVYTRSAPSRLSTLWVLNVESGQKTQLTSGIFSDHSPAFDRAGEYLYFATTRHFRGPIYADVGSTFVYANSELLVLVPLRTDAPSPLAPRSDEERPRSTESQPAHGDEEDADADAESDSQPASRDTAKVGEGEKSRAREPVRIDLDGFESRAVPLPVKPGRFDNLAVTAEGHLAYVRRPNKGSDDKPAIMLFDLKAATELDEDDENEKEEDEERVAVSAARPAVAHDKDKGEKRVLADAGAFAVSADGRKMLVRSGEQWAIIPAKPDQEISTAIDTGGMQAVIDPRAEWRQLLIEAWRIERDFFYDPNMHGIDWSAMRERYAAMLDDCATRADVGYVISELISELNVGHAYYFGETGPDAPKVSVGLLGADIVREGGAFRIREIYRGAPWDVDARGPLGQPGGMAATGDYLLAVDGQPISDLTSPWQAFQGLAGRTVTLTLSTEPKLVPTTQPATRPADPSAPRPAQRDVVVKLLTSEEDAALRYRAWVERNRAYVDRQTDGRVGYIHVPDTGVNGQNELFRQFYGQLHRAALIIDERWNGGGQIPTRFIELLNRPPTNYWDVRDGPSWPWPEDAHFGPKCMLINGLAGSGGDAFPYYFRQAGLGKLIGTRTWGGLVGISGNPSLIDGATVTAPTFAFYELDGTWGIEGWGVAPDIEVIDDPSKMQNGADPQLDAAIAHMLDELRTRPYVPPPTPAPPDRRGMGVLPADR